MLLLLKKSLIFFCIYPRTIVIGECRDKKINEETAFVFDISIYQNLFKCLMIVLDLFRKESNEFKESSGTIATFKDFSYIWTHKSPTLVVFENKRNNISILALELDYFQINEFIFYFYQNIPSTLCLNHVDQEFIHYAIYSNCEFLSATEIEKFENLIQDTKFCKDKFRFFTILKIYIDIIFIISTLKKFCNEELLPTNLQSLLH